MGLGRAQGIRKVIKLFFLKTYTRFIVIPYTIFVFLEIFFCISSKNVMIQNKIKLF